MCRVLGVSVSGSSDWRSREPSRHGREDGERAKEIHRLFYASRGVYGSPRIQVELRERGRRCSRERVARLLREMDLVANPRRDEPLGTHRHSGVEPAPNLLNRQFSAEQPNCNWVSDTV